MATKPKIFFSYTTVARMNDAVYEAVKQFLDEFHVVGPPEVLYKYDQVVPQMAAEAAKLLNCDPSEITPTKNTTEGIIIASEALPLSQGDEVLVLANEYPANFLPWLKKKKDGINLKVIDGTDSPKAFERLLAAISPSTKAIAISAIQYYDGYMMDLELLSRTCREHKIYLVLDAVQAVGIRRIDLQKTPVDFLLCGGQKYLCAGMGCGFMYVNKAIMHELKDTKVGIRSMQSFNQESYILKDTADRFQDGTQNLAGIVALYTALKGVNELGIETIQQKNLELLAQIKACLTKYNITYIDHGEKQGNIVSMPVSDSQGLFEYLKDNAVYTKPAKDVARLSFIHTSRMEDVEVAAQLIRQWMDEHPSA